MANNDLPDNVVGKRIWVRPYSGGTTLAEGTVVRVWLDNVLGGMILSIQLADGSVTSCPANQRGDMWDFLPDRGS